MSIRYDAKRPDASYNRSHKEPMPAVRTPISRSEMIELFDYLDDGILSDACDHSLRYTESFLVSHGIELRPTLDWIRELGATCDCEILQNVEFEWGAIQ